MKTITVLKEYKFTDGRFSKFHNIYLPKISDTRFSLDFTAINWLRKDSHFFLNIFQSRRKMEYQKTGNLFYTRIYLIFIRNI